MNKPVEILQKCILLHKKVMINGQKKAVYGLRKFRVSPMQKGMGKAMLKGIENVAESDGKFCVVAFCLEDVLDFYKKCGWYENGIYDEQYYVLTSIPVESIEVTERW